MSAIWRSLLRDERGFVITAELVLISTVLVLGLVAALSAVKTALAGELSDVAKAVGSVNQSYYTHGFTGHGSRVYGSSFLDETDTSDEEKADFATGIEPCKTTVLGTAKTGCATPPCNPPCEKPCATPPCNGCETTLATLPALPVGAPCGTPCETPCPTPCGANVAAPCETPCASPCPTPCATAVAAPCGSPCQACGSLHQPSTGCGSSNGYGYGNSYGLANGYGTPFGPSIPRPYCPPGPGPYTGTDPFAPGVVSPKNMLLQGISYGGVCAPPAGTSWLPGQYADPGAYQQPWGGAPAMQPSTVQSAPADPRFRAPVLPPQEGVVPTNYEGQYEPAFQPPLPLRGSVY